MGITLLALLFCIFVGSDASALDPHVEAVIRTVEAAKGKVEKTADGQSLRLVDVAVPNAGPHDKRTEDPYDAAFFEHLGHVTTLESLNIISTKFNDVWMPHIAKLTNLKSLRFTNNGKLTDAGMEQLAGLRNLEQFSFVGTQITGNAYAKFEGFTKLTKLRGIELGTHNATPAALQNLADLPLESIQLGEGFLSTAALTTVKAIPTLRRLSLTDGSELTDADLRLIAGITQLDSLSIDRLALPEQRLPILAAFAHLKSITFAIRPAGYPAETQAKVRALLPNVTVRFVP